MLGVTISHPKFLEIIITCMVLCITTKCRDDSRISHAQGGGVGGGLILVLSDPYSFCGEESGEITIQDPL